MNDYAHVDSVKTGSRLIADDFSICIEKHRLFTVLGTTDLYIKCKRGEHSLQYDQTGERYVGFWLEGEQPSDVEVKK